MGEMGVIAERSLPAIGDRAADILIAIPTFNNEETIGGILRTVRTARLQFSRWKALIVQIDGGSSDSTMQRAKDSFEGDGAFAQASYPVFPVHQLDGKYHALPGRDSAYRTIFSLAEQVDAKACCIVDGVCQCRSTIKHRVFAQSLCTKRA